jgi:hypothetical protein
MFLAPLQAAIVFGHHLLERSGGFVEVFSYRD